MGNSLAGMEKVGQKREEGKEIKGGRYKSCRRRMIKIRRKFC